MVCTEKRWLLSIVTSVVLAVTMLFTPTTVLAVGEGEPEGESPSYGTPYQFTNSDGQAVDAWTDDDGFVYQIVNSDGTEEDPNMVAKIYGSTVMTNETTSLDIPDDIIVGDDSYPVVSVAIDPRFPVGDESYDAVETISLPETLQHHHFLRFFENLQAVDVADGNPYFINRDDGVEDGVLYGLIGDWEYDEDDNEVYVEKIGVDFYPRGKTDISWDMWDQVYWTYHFYKGCPLEEITLPSARYWIDGYDLRNLNNLKAVYVPEIDLSEMEDGNSYYTSEDGILFENEKGSDRRELVVYPCAKEYEVYTLPDDVSYVYWDAFRGQQNLQKLVIPDNVSFSSSVFRKCTSLKTIQFTSTELPVYKKWRRSFRGLRKVATRNQTEILYPEGEPKYEELALYLRGERQLNYWREAPYAAGDGVFPLGGNINIIAKPGYGEATFIYSDEENGEYTAEVPEEIGIYYAKAVVARSEEYIGIVSSPVQFEIVEPEVNTETGKYANSIELIDDELYSTYGEDYTIRMKATFGTPVLMYKPVDDEDAEWTLEKPVDAGEYYFKAVVEETDEYDGAEYDSSAEGIRYNISQRGVEIWVECDDITEGQTPDPQYGIDWPEGLELDISDAEFIYEKRVYDEEEGSYWEELDGVPTEPGKYRVVVSVTSPDPNYYIYSSSDKFEIKAVEHTHSLVKTEAKDATCTEDGNNEYYTCEICKNLFSDAEGTKALTAEETVVKAEGHKLTKVGAEPASCTENGNNAYYTCGKCKKLFSDAEGTKEITAADTVIKAEGHKMIKTEAVPATCTEAGNNEYYTCETCNKMYSDKEGTTRIKAEDIPVNATGHKLIKTDAVDATCTEAGNNEYYTCENCKKLFSDKDGTKEITAKDTVVNATGHKLIKTEKVPATCTEAGNIEYYTCENCEKLFSDENGTEEITAVKTVDPVKGHQWDEGVNIIPATVHDEGVIMYLCTICHTVRSETIPPVEPARGEIFQISDGGQYQIRTLNGEGGTLAFSMEGAKTTNDLGKKYAIPASIDIQGKPYRVTVIKTEAFSGTSVKTVQVGKNIDTIEPKAFKDSDVKTLIVTSKKLTKSSVKNSLKGSGVKKTKIIVDVGNKKQDAKFAKIYGKFFTKGNAGGKAKVTK